MICLYFRVKYIYSDVVVYYCDHVTVALHWEIMEVYEEHISYLDSSVGNKKNGNNKKI
jgi:hypothetical protein